MDSQGNGGTVENIRDFAAIRGRRQPRNLFTMGARLEQAEAIHRAAHQRRVRPPARKGSRMKTLAYWIVHWFLLAFLVGTWLRLVYAVFMWWGAV